MSKTKSNTLYNFLHYELTHQQLDVALASKIRAQKTRDGLSCYFVLLPKQGMDVVLENRECAILSHHVSIYENHTVLSEQCEYQYSAMLQSHDGKRTYELQVHFDKSDRKLGPIVLTRIDLVTKEKTSIAIQDRDYELLAEYAMVFSLSMMAPLHHLHQRGQAQLEIDIGVFLCQADNLPCSTVQETELILSRIHKLKQRTNYMDSELAYSVIKQTETGFQWLRDDLQADATRRMVVLVLLLLYWLGKQLMAKVVPINKHNHSGQLVQAVHDMQALKSKYSSDDVDELFEYHNAAQNAFNLLIGSSDRALVIRNTVYINAMFFCSRIRCVKQLSRALEQKNDRAFNVLQEFILSLSDNALARALPSNNPEQFALLLARGTFPVNRILLKADGICYTLLEYAYEYDQIDCFRQLLAYGVSVFTSVNDKLPLIQRILLEQKPLFCEALMLRYIQASEKTKMTNMNTTCPSSSSSSSILSRFRRGFFRVPTGVGSDEIGEQVVYDSGTAHTTIPAKTERSRYVNSSW